MIIRNGATKDLTEITKLWTDWGKEKYPDCSPRLDWLMEELEALTDNKYFTLLIATEKNEIIGYISSLTYRDVGHGCYVTSMHHLYVKPEHRNKGIATKLFHQLDEIRTNISVETKPNH